MVKADDWFAFATVASLSSSPDIVLSSETTFAIHIGISGLTSDDDGLAVKAKFDAHSVAISQCLYSVDLDTALPLHIPQGQ